MDVFKIPLILKPEERKTIQARFWGKDCLINFPAPWLKKKKYLVMMVDRIYWRLLTQNCVGDLRKRAAELNQLYFGFEYKDVRYHRQYRRWGSCSSLKNINLSHRLIGAPQQLSDYVILHELAHLQHLNHGKEFWGLVVATGFQPKLIRHDIEKYGRSWQSEYYQWYHQIMGSVDRIG
jgi:predicted metal-dependent hydrolase